MEVKGDVLVLGICCYVTNYPKLNNLKLYYLTVSVDWCASKVSGWSKGIVSWSRRAHMSWSFCASSLQPLVFSHRDSTHDCLSSPRHNLSGCLTTSWLPSWTLSIPHAEPIMFIGISSVSHVPRCLLWWRIVPTIIMSICFLLTSASCCYIIDHLRYWSALKKPLKRKLFFLRNLWVYLEVMPIWAELCGSEPNKGPSYSYLLPSATHLEYVNWLCLYAWLHFYQGDKSAWWEPTPLLTRSVLEQKLTWCDNTFWWRNSTLRWYLYQSS